MRILCAFFVLIGAATTASLSAQVCPPVGVHYIVRGEDGQILREAELRTVYEQLPKAIGDATTGMTNISVASDGTYNPPYGLTGEKSIPVLWFINQYPCKMHFGEVTLVYRGKKMTLIFNIDFDPYRFARNVFVESPRFEEGTFELMVNPWPTKEWATISADRWKKKSG